LESKVQALQSDIEQLSLNWKKQTEGHKDESINSLKKFLFKERERNAKLLVEKARLKSEYEALRRNGNKKNSVNKKIDAKWAKKPIDENMWSPSSITAKRLPIWENHLPERNIGRSRYWYNLTLGLTVGVCFVIIVFLFYGNFDPGFEKVKSIGDVVTAKIQSILANKPVVDDNPAQDNLASEGILNAGKGDQLPGIIKPANKESNQDRLDSAVADESEMTTTITGQSSGHKTIIRSTEILNSGKGDDLPEFIIPANKESDQDRLDSPIANESEITTPITGQALDKMTVTESKEFVGNNPRPLSPSTDQGMLNSALRKWGEVVFVREGEDIYSLVSRVYGGYHPRLLDAVLKENQELKTNSITEGQAINLPKSYPD
jgi:hypothetical protein